MYIFRMVEKYSFFIKDLHFILDLLRDIINVVISLLYYAILYKCEVLNFDIHEQLIQYSLIEK